MIPAQGSSGMEAPVEIWQRSFKTNWLLSSQRTTSGSHSQWRYFYLCLAVLIPFEEGGARLA